MPTKSLSCNIYPGNNGESVARLQKLECILSLFFLFFLSFPLLYIFRSLDNNRLTSWRWVFAATDLKMIFFLLVLAVCCAFLLSWKVPLEKKPILTLFVFSFLSILPLWGEPELLLDSSRYFLQAKHLSEYGVSFFLNEWGKSISAWTDMPLIPLLYGLIFKFFGETRAAIQLFNTCIFAASVVLTWRIGATLWDDETGFYGGLLLLGIPYLPTQVPLMLVDIHAMFFLLLALTCFLEAILKGTPLRLCIASLAIILAVFTKYSIWPMLAVLPLTSLVYWQKNPQLILKRSVLILLFAALGAMLIFIWQQQIIRTQLDILLNYQRPALKLWQEDFLSTLFFQAHPFISGLAIVGIVRAFQQRDARFLVVGFSYFMIFFLSIQRIRYLLPLMPFYTLMGAYGLGVIRESQVKRFLSLGIVAFSLVILYGVYLPFFKTTSMMNMMVAGNFLNTLKSDSVGVIFLPQINSEGNTAMAIPQLDLYTNKKIHASQSWPNKPPSALSPYSPLLFSWKQKKPLFYPASNQLGIPRVIISSNMITDDTYSRASLPVLPKSQKKFTRQAGIFRYKTFVEIIAPSLVADEPPTVN